MTIADYEEITFTAAALLTGYHLCGVGVAGILIVPTARVWGKRHLFLLGHVLMIVSCVWAGASGKNKNSLLWARVFQGVALAPFEALVNACVGDLYFVHVSGNTVVGGMGDEGRGMRADGDRNEANEWQFRTLRCSALRS